MLFSSSLLASVWGGRNGREGVKGEGSVRSLCFGVETAVLAVWSLNRAQLFHLSQRAAAAPTSG